MHRALILGALLLILGGVAFRVNWSELPGLLQAVREEAGPIGKPVPQIAGESADERRARLRDLVLARGQRLLANLCDAPSHSDYRDAFIALARQRLADAGCGSDYKCMGENGPSTSSRLYTTDKDRQISWQYIRLVKQGAIIRNELGWYTVLVGHPQEAPAVLEAAFPLDAARPCKDANKGSGG